MEKHITTLIERYTNVATAGSDNEMHSYGLDVADILDIISDVEEAENVRFRKVDEEKLLLMPLSKFISWVERKIKA